MVAPEGLGHHDYRLQPLRGVLLSAPHHFGESCSFWRTHFSVTHARVCGGGILERCVGQKTIEDSL